MAAVVPSTSTPQPQFEAGTPEVARPLKPLAAVETWITDWAVTVMGRLVEGAAPPLPLVWVRVNVVAWAALVGVTETAETVHVPLLPVQATVCPLTMGWPATSPHV